jgi:N-acylglucosamine-6-phosphate 2-epimerase
MKETIADALKGKLIVSCQALEDEPLHSSFIMSRMARAAEEGGAKGIRANTKEDIAAIKEECGLPIIGIVKRDYPDSSVRITPTMKEVDELMEVKPDIIAMDATCRKRPDGQDLQTFFAACKEKYPNQLWMADVATLEEAVEAGRLGFDFVGPTLVGYTEQSEGKRIDENDFTLVKDILKNVSAKVIAEGNFDTPQKAAKAIDLGCWCVVVGSAITRPQLITAKFASALPETR